MTKIHDRPLLHLTLTARRHEVSQPEPHVTHFYIDPDHIVMVKNSKNYGATVVMALGNVVVDQDVAVVAMAWADMRSGREEPDMGDKDEQAVASTKLWFS